MWPRELGVFRFFVGFLGLKDGLMIGEKVRVLVSSPYLRLFPKAPIYTIRLDKSIRSVLGRSLGEACG